MLPGAILGLYLGDRLGPLSGLVYDWDAQVSWEDGNALRRVHGFLVGFGAACPI